MFELASAGHDRAWVDSLCPADLFHYHGLLMERRTRELRELLNVQVAAAAVTIDRGEAYRKLSEALDGGSGQQGGKAEETWQPATTAEQTAEAAAVFAAAEGIGKRRTAA